MLILNKVLFICTDWWQLAGSSLSLLNLLDAVKHKVYPIVLIPYEGEAAKEFRSRGYEVLVCPFFFLWEKKPNPRTLLCNPLKARAWRYWHLDRRCARYVAEKLESWDVQIVHSNSTITTVGVKVAKHLHAKHVWHIREFLDLDFHINVYRGRVRLKKIIDKADMRICISNAIAKHWDFCSETMIIPDAVHKSSDVVYNPKKNKYFLFCATSLSDNKGANTAVKAFAKSEVWKDDYKLVLIGNCSDEYRIKLLQITDSLGAPNDILQFVGFQKDVRTYFEKATAFLMCSEYEGLGRVSVEAMFYGCLVIGRNSGGTVDFIHNSETGYLFDTVEECADLIKEVILKNNEPVIKKAQELVLETFTEEVYGERILNIYEKVLNA